jgi:phosphate:Na+ symporter
LTGLGLFFCGVHSLSSHLVPLASRRIRTLLMRVGGRPWLAAAFGSLAGVLMQSTNAVTSVIIGLVSGGLIDKRRAILIPTWSHVGTSILVILVAIDLSLAAGYLVALAGVAVYFGFDRNDHLRHAVGILLGLGLLFVGMQMLKSGIRPLREDLIQGDLFAEAARSPLLLLLLGTVLSLLCQSSSVAGALAIAGTGNGLVDLSGACWLVYGANLGSGVNYALLSRTHRGEASQIALMQVLQKFAGFAAVLVVLVIEMATGDKLIERGAMALARTTSGQVAWVFLMFQIAGSGICTVFLQHILPLLERAAPPSELQELSKPAYLIEEALVEPAFAIELVAREEHRLLERLPMMLDTIRADAIGPFTSPQTLRAAGTAVTRAMAAYLSSIIDSKLDRAEREQTVRLQHRTANFRRHV